MNGCRAAALLALSALCLPCLGACGRNEEAQTLAIRLVDMPCSGATADATGWLSHPLPASDDPATSGTSDVCSWLSYPGRATLRIEHDLGRPPDEVRIDIAFTPTGIGSTPASGDPARIRSASASEVVIRNSTNQDFFVRVVLR